MSPPSVTVAGPLSCPIAAEISPHAEAAQRWLADWLVWHGWHVDDSGRQTLHATGVARYAARLYPTATPDRLRVLTALFAWCFLLDDAADTAALPEVGRLRGLLTGALATLRHAAGPSAEFAGPLHRMLSDLWRQLRAGMPPAWQARFVDAMRHHLSGMLVEAEAKAGGQRPSVERYVRLRRATSAAYVAYVLAEFAVERPLPDAVAHHPTLQEHRTAGNDLLSWFNDLLSLDRDAATAGGHNLVLALADERGLSIPDAVEEAVLMWRARMAELTELRAAAPALGPSLDAPLREALDAVDRSVRGTIDWSLESVRYRVPEVVAPYL